MKITRTAHVHGNTFITVRSKDASEYCVITINGLFDANMNDAGTALTIQAIVGEPSHV